MRSQRERERESTQSVRAQDSSHQRITGRLIEDKADSMRTIHDIYEGLLAGMEDTLARGAADSYAVIKEEIDKFMQVNYRNPKYTVSKKPDKNGKFVVNCRGDLSLRAIAKELTNELFVFGKVANFICFDNRNITSLKGAPVEVETINCGWCYNLTSLEGCPQIIKDSAKFNDCNITSLHGLPKIVDGDLNLSGTDIVDLEGSPERVNGYFAINECHCLKSLKGAPKYIAGNFECSECENLVSLDGGPQDTQNYWCRANGKLTSLKGVAKNIRGSLIAEWNQSLTSLDIPDTVIARHFNIERCTKLVSFEGSPISVGEDYIANHCKSVTSLKGLPSVINRCLDVSFCPNIRSLDGCPKTVKEMFDIHGGHKWTRDEITAVCDCPIIAV